MKFKATIKNNQNVASEIFYVPPKLGPVKVKISDFTQPPTPSFHDGELILNKKIHNEMRLFVILQKENPGSE